MYQTHHQGHGPKILVVENDLALTADLKSYLENNGVNVCVEKDRQLTMRRVEQENPDLLLLDLLAPEMSGIQMCSRIREKTAVPIIIMSDDYSDNSHIRSLESGADDFINKDIHMPVLLARVRALWRRSQNITEDIDEANKDEQLFFTNLLIDHSAREVRLNDEPVELTSAEFDLLWLLASNAGTILSREQIFDRLRGIEYDGQDRSIDVRISRIRPKIGDDPNNPKRIKTVRSKGYLFTRTLLN